MNVDQQNRFAIQQFLADVKVELESAQVKFPQPNPTFTALGEEFGEVANALLELKSGKKTVGDVYKECVQTAAMAARVALEGDPAFPESQAR